MESFWSFINTPVANGYPTPIVLCGLLIGMGWVFASITTPKSKQYKMVSITAKYSLIVAVIMVLMLYLYYYQRRMRYIEGFDYINLPGEPEYQQFGNVWKNDDKQKIRHILGVIWMDDRESDGDVLDKESLLGWALNERNSLPWDDNVVVASKNPKQLIRRISMHPDVALKGNKVFIRKDLTEGKEWPFVEIVKRKDTDQDQDVVFENVKCKVPKCWRKRLQDIYGTDWDNYIQTPKRCARTNYMVNPSIRIKRPSQPTISIYN